MTPSALLELFDEWQSRLGLDDWTIEIRFDAPESDTAVMECVRDAQYEQAVIYVHPAVFDAPEKWRTGPTFDDFFFEKSVVHELLHCIFRDMRYVEELFEDRIQPDLVEGIEKTYKRVEERTVDKLAVALVRAWNG
jgi:hypothetical protein